MSEGREGGGDGGVKEGKREQGREGGQGQAGPEDAFTPSIRLKEELKQPFLMI